MNGIPLVVIYKSRKRDLQPLEQYCTSHGMSLCIAEEPLQFQQILSKESVSCIIVPLESDESGGHNIREFADIASTILLPEDADITIIYSTEGHTPDKFPGALDPRPIKGYDNDPQFIAEDKQWRNTIDKLNSSRDRFSYRRNKAGIVKTEFQNNPDVPFPTEAIFLLRAAFKDMSKISVDFPSQGLSGSIACVIHPFDAFGNPCKPVFAKIYPDLDKAWRELERCMKFAEPYISHSHYPAINLFRRYRGNLCSLMVTDLIEGPGGQELTFMKMIMSSDFSLEQTQEFILDILSIMNNLPRNKPDERSDLLNDYLQKYLDDEQKRIRLDSENLCNKWFGSFPKDLPLEEKIRDFLPKASLEGTSLGVCHGDFHSENIMGNDVKGKLIPFFIDYSRADGGTHSVKDLVTLESDMIIRGLSGIEGFHDAIRIKTFLESLEKVDGNHNNIEPIDMNEELQLEKARVIIKELRKCAVSDHGVSEIEYAGAALLKTLEVLSYGKLPHDQTIRATTYVTYLCRRIQEISNQ